MARDTHFVTALDRPVDLAFYREAGTERLFELTRGRRPKRQPARECQPSNARYHCRDHAVAHGHLEMALVILQLADVDDWPRSCRQH